MKASDCLNMINQTIRDLQRLRIKRQTEIDCLGEEINRLENMAFEIEKNIDKET